MATVHHLERQLKELLWPAGRTPEPTLRASVARLAAGRPRAAARALCRRACCARDLRGGSAARSPVSPSRGSMKEP
jgi:hypothetical protein